ncbi:unnamed protein product [Rotaria sp. Silwood1]|nr:unnamed protein product [Rotaria sp. Silwood1]
MGSPRVGKNQLINAICNGENKAEISASLNSCTKDVTCYFLEDNQQQMPGVKPFRVNFYDTPGIESWTDQGGTTAMRKFIEEKDSVCVIYCAAPGTFADLAQIRPILKFCQEKKYFELSSARICGRMPFEKKSFQFNIAVCGSTCVGKSTLVNALCGKEVAKTSSSLCSTTNEIKKYVLNRTCQSVNEASSSTEYTITVWDTPGIESWTIDNVQKHFTQIMVESTPLCMIYCASPGSFARLDQLKWLVETCIKSNIFCALVCTNKYSGGSKQRAEVLKDFHSLLTSYHAMTREEANIKYYGNVALCTSVNSIIYEDMDYGVRKDVEGINELIFAIITSLKDDKLVAWCYTIAENESFWLTMRDKVVELFNISRPILEELLQKHGKDMAKFIIPLVMNAVFKKL